MDNKFLGMTVNERLHVSGLMDKFDKAVKEKDVETVVSILNEVVITGEASINPILEQLNLRPNN
jgi:hypothetical protein